MDNNNNILRMRLLYPLIFLLLSCSTEPEDVKDCAGVENGTATIDDCGLCTGGATANVANYLKDCAGECGGDAIEDCLGVCNGLAVTDECGTCDSDSSNDCIQDCAAVWGGLSYLDECGNCDANVNNDGFMDECGTCDSDSSNDCIQDCDGIWGGNTPDEDNDNICDYNQIAYDWQLDSYTIENTEINLFGQAGSSCCIYDLSRNWDFQENGKITVDKVSQYYPDGTGEIIEGDWNIIGDKINIFFEPNLDYYDFSSDSTFIMNYFNNNLFEYLFTDSSMIFFSTDTTLVFTK